MRVRAIPLPVEYYVEYYLDMAMSLREDAAVLKTAEARIEVLALAAEYERLADFVRLAEMKIFLPNPAGHRRP